MLSVGDDRAEDHHDVEVMDQAGKRLAKARLPEGVAGMARLHAMIGEQLGEPAPDEDEAAAEVLIGIETDRGPWVQALLARTRRTRLDPGSLTNRVSDGQVRVVSRQSFSSPPL
ncbi:hypothetical protein [Nonomuraea sp. CA-141351]|uniref:hypothetical protein n=1 Tax=Nonomuraea sp. CA-141351 TaxID=3239996 RepID=UPI003D92EA6F